MRLNHIATIKLNYYRNIMCCSHYINTLYRKDEDPVLFIDCE